MKESLEHLLGKSKLLKEEILIVFLIVLVGAASFGLGRLSVSDSAKTPVRIVYPAGEGEKTVASSVNVSAAAANTAAAVGQSPEKVVASKSGSKYHFPWCPGASRISQKNKIWFDSPAQAEAAGYEKASNCPGL